MSTCITLVLACKQAQTSCTVTGMPLPLDKSNGGSGDEISSGNVSLLAGYPGSIKDNKMTYHVKSTELFECAKWMKFGVVFEAGFITEMAILPHLSRFYCIVRSRCYTGSNRSKEKGTRVKDRTKNRASKRAGLALVPFFAWPKPKILFLGLPLLRNHTETLATQAKSLWSLWPFNPCGRYCCCGPCGRGSCGHCGPCVNWITLYLLS